jgi:hypothetical protein
VKTSCLQELQMHQRPGFRAVPSIIVIGSAAHQFWRNEPICKKPDRSMRQVSRRTPASRSQHGLPPSAAVLAKQTQCVDPADAHLSGGKRFRRHEAAGVNRGLIAARRRGRVARRGDRSFLQNTKHKTN